MARVKELVLIVLGCLLTVVANPAVLSADDNFSAQAPDFSAAETTIAERLEEAENERALGGSTVAETAAIKTVLQGLARPQMVASEATARVPAVEKVARNYNVTINLATRNDYLAVSAAPSYGDIYRYGRMIFAHNTANLFGSLSELSTGETITLTENGAKKTYAVSEMVYYDKTEKGLNNDPMMINKLSGNAFGHSAALMTCAGVMYGNGDASQRLVVYIDALY